MVTSSLTIIRLLFLLKFSDEIHTYSLLYLYLHEID